MEKRLEEIKVKCDKVRKSLAEEQKSIRERQEVLRKQILVMKALEELLMENADFRKQFESKLEELISKEKEAALHAGTAPRDAYFFTKLYTKRGCAYFTHPPFSLSVEHFRA